MLPWLAFITDILYDISEMIYIRLYAHMYLYTLFWVSLDAPGLRSMLWIRNIFLLNNSGKINPKYRSSLNIELKIKFYHQNMYVPTHVKNRPKFSP
jgi:hypothetical protein